MITLDSFHILNAFLINLIKQAQIAAEETAAKAACGWTSGDDNRGNKANDRGGLCQQVNKMTELDPQIEKPLTVYNHKSSLL